MYDRKPWSKRRPHSRDPGYVASLRCKRGGWIVVYDRQLTMIDADRRWVVMHQPSGLFFSEASQTKARDWMKTLAAAKTHSDFLTRALERSDEKSAGV